MRNFDSVYLVVNIGVDARFRRGVDGEIKMSMVQSV